RKRGGRLERLKPMRNSSAAASAADQEPYRPELVADEEPRYLRRQKPVEIRRKKFNGKTWPFYRRLFLWLVIIAILVTAAVYAVRYALYSPQMLLLKPDQIEVAGNHIVPQRRFSSFSSTTATAASCAYRWMSAARRSRNSPGWRKPAYSASCQIICASRSASARPSPFSAMAPSWSSWMRTVSCLTGRRVKTSISPSSPDFRKACRAKSAKSA